MSYPSLEQYNEAFQHPQTALVDPELKTGRIATTGLGLPLALCGGFALTYTVKTGIAKYAVRCFHKQSNALEKRYNAISNRIKSLRSPYFLDFEFQPQGIRVNGKAFPVVKMAWAFGDTLGEFLERRYRNKIDLQQLNSSLRILATFIEGQSLAHGDIQPGNVMVSDGGRSIQLIDYDGMFVDDLRSLGSAELGHRNFQHPRRIAISWNPRLDRFSFIALNLALRVLEAHPDLWRKTQSDGDAILFKVNDFADPDRSTIFSDLLGRPQFAKDAKNLATVCKAAFDKIPTLEDFLAQKNIPQVALQVSGTAPIAQTQYMAAFPAIDATNYTLCFQHVGDRVELIGRIVEVKQNKTHDGRPYIFINFGPWKGETVKINIWSEGLSALTQYPDQSWIEKWISVIGLMEPPYRSQKYKYSHLSISITQTNQLHVITESEAKFRLSGTSTRSSGLTSRSSNKEILGGIRGTISTPSRATTTRRVPTRTNQDVLQAMKGSQPAPTPLSHGRPAGQPKAKTKSPTAKQAPPPQRETPPSAPKRKATAYPPPIEIVSSGKSNGGSGGKWILGIIGVVFVIWLVNNGGKSNKKSSYNPPSPSQSYNYPQSTPAPVAQTPSTIKSTVVQYTKPSVGTNNMLSVSEIRWCIRGGIRIEAMRDIVDTNEDIDEFNKIVNDYNSRCGSYRYRQSSQQRAERDVEAYRNQIVSEAIRDARQLGRSYPSVSPGASISSPPKRPSAQYTREAQQLLIDLGYDPGPVDGQYGDRTAAAVEAFQRDVGIAQDGWIDHDLMNTIRKAKAAHKPSVSTPSTPRTQVSQQPRTGALSMNSTTTSSYFTSGSHQDDVLRIQGRPDYITDYSALGYEEWKYGRSSIKISTRDRRVMSWDNNNGNLRAR